MLDGYAIDLSWNSYLFATCISFYYWKQKSLNNICYNYSPFASSMAIFIFIDYAIIQIN